METAASHTLETKIATREARVGIIGLGYVGLPLSMMYAGAGFPVIGFDIDNRKVESLEQGHSYIKTISSQEVKTLRTNGFVPTASFNLLSGMDAIIICVPTPLNEYHEPDLTAIRETCKAITPRLRPGQLVVLESTTYPGTTREVVIPILEKSGLKAGVDFHVAFSPEREDPGNPIERTKIPKVVGGIDQKSGDLAAALYGGVFERVVRVSSTDTAEMTKLLENIYRCVNIALVNELKLLSLRMGIDIYEVIEAAKTKPFGFQAFYPGPGLGGHCIPIDPFYLSWKAKEFDFRTKFIDLAGEINTQMPYHVRGFVADALNQHRKALKGSRILVLGMAYKKDIDDYRESPSIAVIKLLKEAGAIVDYNDPYVPSVTDHGLNMHSASLGMIPDYDCVVILTDHSVYDYKKIVADAQLVVCTRNATKGIDSPKIVRV
jgi:UDP-N-acetyl-D-glucosamine dehydrogenase